MNVSLTHPGSTAPDPLDPEGTAADVGGTTLGGPQPAAPAVGPAQPAPDPAHSAAPHDAWGEALCEALIRLEAGQPAPADLAHCQQLAREGGLNPAHIAQLPAPWQPLFQALLASAPQ